MSWYTEDKEKAGGGRDRLLLNIYVVPRSSKSEVVGLYNDMLKIKLKASPIDNEANEELIRFLAAKLKVSKSNIEIIKGHKQRRKVITCRGLSRQASLWVQQSLTSG